MTITLSALQKQRRDTASNWTSNNPTLLAGEWGIESDTKKFKIGDGTTAWQSLDYVPIPDTNRLLTGNLTVGGNFTVNGTSTTIDTTTLTVEDKNIEIGKVSSPSDTTADNGGITLKGATDKTINWLDSTDSWTLSENLDLASGKVFKIAGTQILSATQYTGNSATTTALATARTIGGVSFNGSADINLPGVNNAGNQNTTGSAATLTTPRSIAGVNFDGSANISLNNNAITNGAGYITGSSLNASNLTSGTIPDARFPSSLPAISGANLTNLPSSGISSIVEDTSPQLGGDLDTNSHNISLDDDHKINFGDSNDLQIFHDQLGNRGDAGFNKIESVNSHLDIQCNNNVSITVPSSSNSGADTPIRMAHFQPSNSVELYFNGSKKFETLNDGINITGTLKVNGSAFSGGLANVVEDTSPQLGGNLDVNTKNIVFGDSSDGSSDDVLSFGASADLKIYHSGSDSWIRDLGTGNLYLDTQGAKVAVLSNATKTMANFIADGAAELYHNGTKKLETSSTGVSIDGNIVAGDNDHLYLGTGQDINIYHDGTDSYFYTGAGTTFFRNASNEKFASFISDGGVELYYDNSKKFETKSDGVLVTGELQATTLDINGNGHIDGTLQLTDDLFLADNDEINIGSSNDLKIYHDGSNNNSYIRESGTGNLVIGGAMVNLTNYATNESYIRCTENAQVELYYDNSKKFETTSGGAQVTGSFIALDSTSNGIHSRSSSTQSTDTNKAFKIRNNSDTDTFSISYRGNVFIPDSNKINLGTGNDLQIYHNGTDSIIDFTSTAHNLKIMGPGGSNYIEIQPRDNNSSIKAIANNAVELYFDASKKLSTSSSGITVTGSVTETSDIALKSNIKPLENTLEKIQQITGYKYNLINSISPSMGVIAQDVEKVFPELVHGSEGKKTLQYSGLIGVLIEAVKDLSAKVAALEAK